MGGGGAMCVRFLTVISCFVFVMRYIFAFFGMKL